MMGSREGDVEITENRDQLVKEASRLNRAVYFLKRFIAEAKRQGVDIEQAATAINENGDGIQVLFDVMTHTLGKSSWVGDHGKTGIDIFLKKHECGNRCSHLHLNCEGSTSEGVAADSDVEA
ncbi:hypothetical protein B0H14DRAFT_2573714 [Mycena olivaceomarginata]|nr:hypothetical protein B0H14DRAFT_2573714 [Mycena olivaceomarginata]